MQLASERSERDTIRGLQTRASAVYIYIYIYVWRYLCHNSSASHAYVMWAELGHCHFLYVPAVFNVVTTGNSTGTKNVLKWNRALGFEFSIQSSVYGATTVAKVSLFSTWTRYTIGFYSYVSAEIGPFSCEQHRQFSTQSIFIYLVHVNVCMITGLVEVSIVCYWSINR